MQSSTEILASILKLLSIHSNREKVQHFYNNYLNIIRIVEKLIYNSQEATFLGINLQHLNQIKATHCTQSFYGALILRLLYIDLPESLIQQAMRSTSNKSKPFLMLKSIGQQLLQTGQLSKLQECQTSLIKYFQIVKQNAESQFLIIKALPIIYQYQDFTHVYLAEIGLQTQTKQPSKKTLFSNRINDSLQNRDYSQLCSMYDDILNNLKQQKESQFIHRILYHLSLVLGAVLYFETICQRHQLLTNPHILVREDEKTQSFFRTHAFLTGFDIRVELSGKQQPSSQCFLNISIKFRNSDVSHISPSEFHLKQRKIGNYLNRRYLNYDESLYISEMIYHIDFSKVLGSGTFGSVLCAKALRFHSIRQSPQIKDGLQLLFLKKEIALKRLKNDSAAYQKAGYRVDLKRELHILSLLKEIKHAQALKGARRQLGFETERDLVGIHSLITLQQIMKIPDSPVDENYTSTATLKYNRVLTFERGTAVLDNKDLLAGVNNRAKKEAIIYKIYKQVLEGLYCLHTDLNKLYSHHLKTYFEVQDRKEDNQTNAKINRTDRCGIYHRDIKSSNIIINYQEPISQHMDQITVRIIDFGMAGIANFQKYQTRTNCGSSHFMAPEIKAGEKYNEKVDIWSTGVILYEHLNNGSRLYKHYGNSNTIKITQEIINKYIRDLELEVQQKKWIDIVKGCLIVNPEDRNTSGEVLNKLQHNKLELTHEKIAIIERFYQHPHQIVSVKARLMQHQYEQVHVEVTVPQVSIAYHRENVRFSTLQEFIIYPARSPQQKLPVILSFVSLFINGCLMSWVSGNILQAIRQCQVLVFQKECQNGSGQSYMFIDFKIAQEKIKSEHEQKFETKGDDLTVNNIQISQQMQLILETTYEAKQSAKAYKLILSNDKKYLLKHQPNIFLYGGYQVQTGSAGHYRFRRNIFLHHNRRYTEFTAPFQLLSSSKIAAFQTRKYIEIYWYSSQLQSKDKKIIFKLKELFQLIKTQRDRGKMIRIMEMQRKQNMVHQSKMELEDDTLCISILQSSLRLLASLIKAHEPFELFSKNTKQIISYIFQSFKASQVSFPYQYAFEMSLIHFCNQLSQYLHLSSALQAYKSSKQYLYSQLSLCLISVIKPDPIKSKKSCWIECIKGPRLMSMTKKHKRLMQLKLMEALIQELSMVTLQIGTVLETRFQLKKIKNQTLPLYKQKEKPPSLRALFDILQKILKDNKVYIIDMKALQYVLMNHKDVLVSLDVLRWLFMNSTSEGGREELCPQKWIDQLPQSHPHH